MATTSDVDRDPHVFASITCALRARSPAVHALVHVVELLDTFLDVSVRISLQEAAKSGATSLFDRVCKRQRLQPRAQLPPTNGDRCLQEYHLSKAMEQAVEHGHMAIVQRIHALHPQRMAVKLLPLAAAYGDLGLFQWLLTRRTDGVCATSPLYLDTLSSATGLRSWSCCLRFAYANAIQSRHLHIVKWLLCNGFDPSHSIGRAGDAAAASGDLDMVVWFHEQNIPSSFTSNAIHLAAQGGHTEIVRYLLTTRRDGFTIMAVYTAAVGGFHEIHKMLQTSGVVPDRFGKYSVTSSDKVGLRFALDRLKSSCSTLPTTVWSACSLGYLDTLQWLVAQYKITFDHLDVTAAAAGGHLHVLQWIHSHECGEWHADAMNDAARKGHLAVIQWLHVNRQEGCTTSAMDKAASNGHLQVVQWFHEHRPEGCTTSAMDEAARNGHLQVVQFLHTHRTEGCTASAMDRAAWTNHLDVVRYLHENRTEGCTVHAMDGAAQCGHLEMVIWLHTNRTEGCSTGLMDRAAPLILQWLHWNRPDTGCTVTAMNYAAGRGDLATLDFLYEHRTERCSLLALQLAIQKGHLHSVQWLCAHYPDMVEASLVHEAACSRDQTQIMQWASDQLDLAQPNKRQKVTA